MSNFLSALLQFSNHEFSWIAQFFSLVLLPFAHEDLAIILGAYLVVNKIMPIVLVVLCIYCGMVASDFALYGIGAGARRLPWLNRLAVDDRVRAFAETLKRDLFGLVALCRVVPGVVFIALIACGWMRMPLGRFTLASFAISALYLPLMLYLVIVFGDALDDHVGWWTWPMLVAALASVDFVRRRVFSFQPRSQDATERPSTTASVLLGHGDQVRPAGNGFSRPGALADLIPPALFYLPLMLSWAVFAWRYRSLTLPTAANPRLPAGGRKGETKSDYLNDVSASERVWIADFVVLTRTPGPRTLYADLEHARQSLEAAGLTFPLVAKPDIGRHGDRVRLIDDVLALREYLAGLPGGTRLILQRFIPLRGEAVVIYARLPGAAEGRILSLTFHHCPYVIGDGKSSVHELIDRNKPAHWKKRLQLGDTVHERPRDPAFDRIPACGEVVELAMNGAHCRDARRHITAELEARFDVITGSMSEFHYGRFDLRFGSLDDLKRGDNFAIVDISGINGIGTMDAWDPHLPLVELYRRGIDQQRIAFLIGEKNRARGFQPARCSDFLKFAVRRMTLVGRQPASA